MGHDTTAYNIEKVAFMRKNAFNSTNGRIYELLDCEFFNGGVSGLGYYFEFEFSQIKKAYDSAIELHYEEEQEFLKTIIDKNETSNRSILIRFG